MTSPSFVTQKNKRPGTPRLNSARESPRNIFKTSSAPNSAKSLTKLRDDSKKSLSARKLKDVQDDDMNPLYHKKKTSLPGSARYDLNGRKIVDDFQDNDQLNLNCQELTADSISQLQQKDVGEIFLTTIKESSETIKSSLNENIERTIDATSNVNGCTVKVNEQPRSTANRSSDSEYFARLKKTLPPNAMTLINRNFDTKTSIPKKTADISPRPSQIPIASVNNKRSEHDHQSQVNEAPNSPANTQESTENQLRKSAVCSNSQRVRESTYTITKTVQSCIDLTCHGLTNSTVSDPINASTSNTNKINYDPANYNETEINQTDSYHSARESMITLKEQLSANIYKERTPQKKIPKEPATLKFGTCLAFVVFIVILLYCVFTSFNEDTPEYLTQPAKPPRPPSKTGLSLISREFLRNLLRIWREFLERVWDKFK